MPARCNRSRNCTVSENCQFVPFSFPLVQFFCSFRRLAVSRMFRDTMILGVWRGMTRVGTPRRRKIPRGRERDGETLEPLVRSIKICACATSSQQACTLFLTAIKEMRAPFPPPRDTCFLFLRRNWWKRTRSKTVLDIYIYIYIRGAYIILFRFFFRSPPHFPGWLHWVYFKANQDRRELREVNLNIGIRRFCTRKK